MGAKRMLAVVMLAVLAGTMTAGAAEPLDSQRLTKAKDYIADEQWLRAIDELKAAAADPKEQNKDEALFWLAHSQHQARDSAAAVETIRRLEREHPSSRWVRPARSLRIEIAQRLGRYDVLWYTVRPAPVPPSPPAAVPPAAPPAPPPPTLPTPRAARGTPVVRPAPAALPAPPAPPMAWFAETYRPDADARIVALQSLIKTDAEKVIPILKEIALDGENPVQARRALFVLAQSNRPEARATVVEVARTATEAVRISAVRELGRFADPAVAAELLHVYSSGNARVKYQVLDSLGDRAAADALYRIAQSEKERELRNLAIRALGQAGGRHHLATLYPRVPADARRAIILGLFNARGDEELIAIARRERDRGLRQEVHVRLGLLGTPQAREYLRTAK